MKQGQVAGGDAG